MSASAGREDPASLGDLGGLTVDPGELRLEFMRSSGPGGQNVNKVATAVRLSFDVRANRSLPGSVKERLLKLAGAEAARSGVIRVVARRYRTQLANRRDAMERLAALIRKAAVPPKVRRRTKPTRASKERRLEEKRRESRKKQERRRPHDD